MSVLVFGLGAAALLRAAHEQFASIPSRRPPPEPVFVKQNEPPTPTLALLRVEPDVAEKVPDNAAAPIIETVTPAAQAPEAPPAEPEKTAALKLDEPAKLNEAVPAEAVKAEIPAAETMPARSGRAGRDACRRGACCQRSRRLPPRRLLQMRK